jgi:type I restriction-modification system DNA methylase subunit
MIGAYRSIFSGKDSSFEQYMQNAEFKINKPALLIEACKLIDQMEISAFEQDIQGDLYEYLLSHLAQSGRNGQFFTPRHIIRMMVKLVDPKVGDRICDPAAGTGGFLVNAYEHILEDQGPLPFNSYHHNIAVLKVKREGILRRYMDMAKGTYNPVRNIAGSFGSFQSDAWAAL